MTLLLQASLPLQGQTLDQAVDRFASAWASEDLSALQGLLAPTVRLDLEGQAYLGVPPRQVAARVERLLDRYDPAAPRLTRRGGDEESGRGFAEFEWAPRPGGSQDAVPHAIFVAFRPAAEGWRIAELRILP